MADSFSFVHVVTEAKAQGAVSLHSSGERRPESAMTRSEWGNRSVVPIIVDLERAEKITREVRQAPSRKGRPGAERVRILLGHPPRFEDPEAWSQEKLLDWARKSSEWVKKGVEKATGGMGVVESAYLHVDELRPHLHVSVVPSVRDPRNPAGHLRMSWYRRPAPPRPRCPPSRRPRPRAWSSPCSSRCSPAAPTRCRSRRPGPRARSRSPAPRRRP